LRQKAELAPVAATDNRPDTHPLSSGCAQEPWPYGCQWQAQPVKRIIIRNPRPAWRPAEGHCPFSAILSFPATFRGTFLGVRAGP